MYKQDALIAGVPAPALEGTAAEICAHDYAVLSDDGLMVCQACGSVISAPERQGPASDFKEPPPPVDPAESKGRVPPSPGGELTTYDPTKAIERAGVKNLPKLAEEVLIKGDLSKLTDAQLGTYYSYVCRSLGLNPLTQPFSFIVTKEGKKLYARKDAAEQFRAIYQIDFYKPIERQHDEALGLYLVTAYARMGDRTDEATGAVSTHKWITREVEMLEQHEGKGVKVKHEKRERIRLDGDELANAVMRAETKAKRRVTLSIVGLGFLENDEERGEE